MFSFKASEVPVQENNYAPIPAGKYEVKMEEVEEKKTLSGGISWSFKMAIPATGRKFFLNYNVEHANKTAEAIARHDVMEIAKAAGVSKDDISIETLKTNKLLSIDLEQRPYGEKIYYSAKNWKVVESTPAAKKSVPWSK